MKTIQTVQEWKKFKKTKREIGQIWKIIIGTVEWQVQMPKGFVTFKTFREANKFSSDFLKTI